MRTSKDERGEQQCPGAGAKSLCDAILDQRAEQDFFRERGGGEDDQVLGSDARGRWVRGPMKWGQKTDGASERDEYGRTGREAEQQINEVARRPGKVDFHSAEPPEEQEYRESEQDGNAVGRQMQGV